MEKQKKILCIDDEENIRLLLACELEEEGYEVISLGDPLQAMEIIAQQQPDIIILDIKMPHLSGIELLSTIRDRYYDLPVILLSAYSSFKRDVSAMASDYYVVKSGDLTELKKLVKRILQTHI
ncbi:MAG: response regulator [Deltaproteobacteria bacterium]|nr:response regulator [Candidatus Anaeroferrophillus wilburensis]MBN2889740.1 response regulator [Deltaproteobacteria bacterium]